jgi:hypothetical protein
MAYNKKNGLQDLQPKNRDTAARQRGSDRAGDARQKTSPGSVVGKSRWGKR